MLILLAVAAAFTLFGYTIGRVRPYAKLADWTNWQLRFHIDHWVTRPRQAALFTLLLLTDTRNTLHAWRHRKDPPKPRSPAMTFRTRTPHREQ